MRTGEERWLVDGVTGYVCTTPVVAEGMLFFGAWSNDTVDSPLPSWEEFVTTYDKNGDGQVAFNEIEAEKRDYWRGLDRDRDGKYTQRDWELKQANATQFENILVAVKPGGRGDITETHIAWKYRRGLPYVPSPLYYKGRIYLVKDGGLISSLDAKTGEAYYAQKRLRMAIGDYYASPVAADDRIYFASREGKLTVIRAGGDTPESLHQVDFGDRILATPALVDDNVYLRSATQLWAFGR